MEDNSKDLDSFDQSGINLWISDHGIKDISQISYQTKFKGINWTSDIN
jgi:hypothetical protein